MTHEVFNQSPLFEEVDLYALDTRPALDQAATAERLLAAIKGHVLGQASLMGTYTR